ncbi:hypothetical protein PPERSA_06996 [Pseudocohnilembus persalinus]|uniref:Uncharacterized protein n=1 Tax=Pseudocohnilembus persalinus TaxID=266149 RepID=A0A0V0QZR1_PSEPJ|nr:hypothetical protein PPERSA_06996 [Pseudocohnilembus persalinus]|eukprot:KRX07381.1 hypothetical protein PPERSA_06996 [Pseudocohnilembus persalinus]
MQNQQQLEEIWEHHQQQIDLKLTPFLQNLKKQQENNNISCIIAQYINNLSFQFKDENKENIKKLAQQIDNQIKQQHQNKNEQEIIQIELVFNSFDQILSPRNSLQKPNLGTYIVIRTLFYYSQILTQYFRVQLIFNWYMETQFIDVAQFKPILKETYLDKTLQIINVIDPQNKYIRPIIINQKLQKKIKKVIEDVTNEFETYLQDQLKKNSLQVNNQQRELLKTQLQEKFGQSGIKLFDMYYQDIKNLKEIDTKLFYHNLEIPFEKSDQKNHLLLYMYLQYLNLKKEMNPQFLNLIFNDNENENENQYAQYIELFENFKKYMNLNILNKVDFICYIAYLLTMRDRISAIELDADMNLMRQKQNKIRISLHTFNQPCYNKAYINLFPYNNIINDLFKIDISQKPNQGPLIQELVVIKSKCPGIKLQLGVSYNTEIQKLCQQIYNYEKQYNEQNNNDNQDQLYIYSNSISEICVKSEIFDSNIDKILNLQYRLIQPIENLKILKNDQKKYKIKHPLYIKSLIMLGNALFPQQVQFIQQQVYQNSGEFKILNTKTIYFLAQKMSEQNQSQYCELKYQNIIQSKLKNQEFGPTQKQIQILETFVQEYSKNPGEQQQQLKQNFLQEYSQNKEENRKLLKYLVNFVGYVQLLNFLQINDIDIKIISSNQTETQQHKEQKKYQILLKEPESENNNENNDNNIDNQDINQKQQIQHKNQGIKIEIQKNINNIHRPQVKQELTQLGNKIYEALNNAHNFIMYSNLPPLSRAAREILAYNVSIINGSKDCQEHHLYDYNRYRALIQAQDGFNEKQEQFLGQFAQKFVKLIHLSSSKKISQKCLKEEFQMLKQQFLEQNFNEEQFTLSVIVILYTGIGNRWRLMNFEYDGQNQKNICKDLNQLKKLQL